jgi:hypothetical protein
MEVRRLFPNSGGTRARQAIYNRNGMLVAQAFDADGWIRAIRSRWRGTGGGERGFGRSISISDNAPGRAGPADVRLSTDLSDRTGKKVAVGSC